MTTFLRGPTERITLTGFTQIYEARQAARNISFPSPYGAYYGYGCAAPQAFDAPTRCTTSTHSMTLEVKGRAAAAAFASVCVVEIIKTREWYDTHVVKAKEPYRQELLALRELMRNTEEEPAADTAAEAAAGGGGDGAVS